MTGVFEFKWAIKDDCLLNEVLGVARYMDSVERGPMIFRLAERHWKDRSERVKAPYAKDEKPDAYILK